MSESESEQTEEPESEYANTARERVLSAIHTLSNPTKVSTIAEMADCSDQGARNILRDFEQLGVVEKVAEGPIEYDKNEAYFRFRRGQELSDTQSDAEIVSEIQTKWNRHQHFQQKFSATLPATINVEQIQEEYGDDGVAQVRKWSNVYGKLQDYLEALEQKRETKLMLDESLDITSSQQQASTTAANVSEYVQSLYGEYPQYSQFLDYKSTDDDLLISNLLQDQIPYPVVIALAKELFEEKMDDEISAFVTAESDRTTSKY